MKEEEEEEEERKIERRAKKKKKKKRRKRNEKERRKKKPKYVITEQVYIEVSHPLERSSTDPSCQFLLFFVLTRCQVDDWFSWFFSLLLFF